MGLIDAEKLEENEQYDKAYEEYKRAYAQKPNSQEILERLGHVATILGKKEEAAEYYSKILELDATNVMAYEQLMDIYFSTDRYKYYIARGNMHVVQQEISHAISDFKKALDKAQETTEINSTRFVLANLYEQTGKNHQAIDEYLRILDSQEVDDVVYLKLAQVYVKEDSIGSAIGILEKAKESGHDSDNIKESLAQLYLRNNQPDKAREHTKDDLVKVKSLLDEEKNEQAFGILTEIKGEYKKNSEYFSLLAQYYYNVSDWEKSLENVEEFEKFSEGPLLGYQMRALIYEAKGNEFESHIYWAKYNLAKQDKDVALNEYFHAYQIKDNDLVLIRNMAELLEDVGDKNQANEFWEKLAALDSTNRKALEKVAEFKESIGDYRAEAEILEKLYAIDSKNSTIIKKLAMAYEKIRNKQKALEYYNKYISGVHVADDTEQVKAKIAKLQSTPMQEEDGLLDKIMKIFIKR